MRDIETDSTISSPQTSDFSLTNVFMAARHEEGCFGVGVARFTVFEQTRPGAGLKKPSDFVKINVEGATVERD